MSLHRQRESMQRLGVLAQTLVTVVVLASCGGARPTADPAPPVVVAPQNNGPTSGPSASMEPATEVSLPSRPASSRFTLPAPAEDAWYDGRSWAERTLDSLTLEEKIGQMMMPILIGDFSPSGSSSYRRALRMVEEHKVGGIIISVGSPTEVAAKLNRLQTSARLPLLIGADLEGGAGFRFEGVIHVGTGISLGGATRFPPLMAVGAGGEPGLAYEMGRITALEARAIGVHVPFAPVLDVNNNPGNPIINVRALGEEPERVAMLGEAFVRGIQDHGGIATGKHFPGHGDTQTDSHIALPVIRVSRERMDTVELVPFRRAIDAGMGAVMTAHINVPDITGPRIPATLSKAVLTDLLRGDLGFEGLIFTDAMDMSAIDRMFGRDEATVRAVEAGADVILMPPNLAAANKALADAVRSGRLTEERIDESVLRILEAKESLRLNEKRTVDLSKIQDVVGIPAHIAVAQEVANRSIVVLKNDRGLLPLRGTKGARVLSITYRRNSDLRAGRLFNARLRQTYSRLRTSTVDPTSIRGEYSRLMVRARQSNLTVISLHSSVRNGSGTVALPDEIISFVRQMAASGLPYVVLAFGNPYLLEEFPEVQTYVTAWSGVPISERAAADAIVGRIPVVGRAPTRIPPYEIGFGIQIPARPGARPN